MSPLCAVYLDNIAGYVGYLLLPAWAHSTRSAHTLVLTVIVYRDNHRYTPAVPYRSIPVTTPRPLDGTAVGDCSVYLYGSTVVSLVDSCGSADRRNLFILRSHKSHEEKPRHDGGGGEPAGEDGSVKQESLPDALLPRSCCRIRSHALELRSIDEDHAAPLLEGHT